MTALACLERNVEPGPIGPIGTGDGKIDCPLEQIRVIRMG